MLESKVISYKSDDCSSDALSPCDRQKILRDEHDSVLTPIEKLPKTDLAKRNVDSMLSPTEKENAVVKTAQEKPEKKRFFNFDLDDSINNAKNKVKSFVGIKAAPSQTDSKKSRASNKSEYKFFAEIVRSRDANSISQHEHLFDIEDLGSPQRCQSEKSPGEAREYKAEKDSKKKGLSALFQSKVIRYLKIEDNSLVVIERVKNQNKIKSKTSLDRLFQMNVETGTPLKLNLLFVNPERNPALPPKMKSYKIDCQDSFIEDLTKAIKKLNLEMRISKDPEGL